MGIRGWHWVFEPRINPIPGIRATYRGMGDEHCVPGLHINPILGIWSPLQALETGTGCQSPTSTPCWASGACIGHRTPCWGSQPHISPVSVTGYQSPALGIGALYQPCSHQRVSKPHVGYHRPGNAAPHQVPLALHWASPLIWGIVLSLPPSTRQLGFLPDPLGFAPVEQKGLPAPQSHFPALGGDITSTLPGSRMGLCLKKGFFVYFH